MSVESILKNKGRNVYTVRPDHTAGEASALLSAKKVGALVVCDSQGKIAGVVSERDIVHGMSEFGKGIVDMPVRNIMSSPVVTCRPSDPVKKILAVMNERRMRHLPVVENDQLVGIVTIGDCVHHRLKDAQLEVGVLRDFAVIR